MEKLFSSLKRLVFADDDDLLPAFAGRIGRVQSFHKNVLRKVAKRWDLEPMTGEIYAYAIGKKKPVVICIPWYSWMKIARKNPDFLGVTFVPAKKMKEFHLDSRTIVRLPVWCKCIVSLTKNRAIEYTVFCEDVVKNVDMGLAPRDVLKYKALIGGLRMAFGLGFCTPEEGRAIFESAQKMYEYQKKQTNIFRRIAICLFS